MFRQCLLKKNLKSSVTKVVSQGYEEELKKYLKLAKLERGEARSFFFPF